MEGVNKEERVIRDAYQMIRGYHITLHPEVYRPMEECLSVFVIIGNENANLGRRLANIFTELI